MSAVRDRWATWLLETRHGGDEAAFDEMLRYLGPIRDRVLDGAHVEEGDTVLDVGCGDGLIAFGALERVGRDGRVVFSDISQDLLDRCEEIADGDERCRFVRVGATDLDAIDDESVDVVTLRSVLIYVDDRDAAFRELRRVLRPGGRVSLFEPINSFDYPGPDERWGPYDVTPVRELADRVKAVFAAIHAGTGDAMHNFRAEDMPGWVERAGFGEVHLDARYNVQPCPPVHDWDTRERSPGNPLVPSLAEAIDSVLDPAEAGRFRSYLRGKAEAGDGVLRSAHAFLTAVK